MADLLVFLLNLALKRLDLALGLLRLRFNLAEGLGISLLQNVRRVFRTILIQEAAFDGVDDVDHLLMVRLRAYEVSLHTFAHVGGCGSAICSNEQGTRIIVRVLPQLCGRH